MRFVSKNYRIFVSRTVNSNTLKNILIILMSNLMKLKNNYMTMKKYLHSFAMVIFFRFPQNRPPKSSLGDFFISYVKTQKLHNTDNQIVRFA